MTIDHKIRDEKLQSDINKAVAKISVLSSAKLINMNILQVQKHSLLIKDKEQNKLSLNVLLQKKLLKNKQKQFKIKEKIK